MTHTWSQEDAKADALAYAEKQYKDSENAVKTAVTKMFPTVMSMEWDVSEMLNWALANSEYVHEDFWENTGEIQIYLTLHNNNINACLKLLNI